jgi:hypothetical protein
VEDGFGGRGDRLKHVWAALLLLGRLVISEAAHKSCIPRSPGHYVLSDLITLEMCLWLLVRPFTAGARDDYPVTAGNIGILASSAQNPDVGKSSTVHFGRSRHPRDVPLDRLSSQRSILLPGPPCDSGKTSKPGIPTWRFRAYGSSGCCILDGRSHSSRDLPWQNLPR